MNEIELVDRLNETERDLETIVKRVNRLRAETLESHPRVAEALLNVRAQLRVPINTLADIVV
jgi:hypothetical protein